MKAIIADDEFVIIRGLKKLIDWDKINVEIVETYTNGKLAYEGILEHRPDIAILDVSMPEMDGISILKEIQNNNINTKVIFISGFREFEYARNAISYGAVDYILKPINSELLVNAIYKAMNITIKKEEIYNAGEMECKSLAFIYPKEIFKDENKKKIAFFSLYSFVEEYFNKNNLGEIFRKPEGVLCVFNVNIFDYNIWELKKIIDKKIEVIMFYKSNVNSVQEVPVFFKNVIDSKEQSFFGNKPIDIDKKNEILYSKDDYNIIAKELYNGILIDDLKKFQKDYEKLNLIIRDLSEFKKENACFYFGSFVNKYFEKKPFNLNLDIDVLREFNNYTDMSKYIYDLIVYRNKPTVNKEILLTLKYIEENYSGDINLNTIAEIVHMNPFYFSSFFKKHMNVNFKEYLNNYRLEKSIEFISSNMKNYEISSLVGFPSSRSFSKAFKSKYGVSPSEYKF